MKSTPRIHRAIFMQRLAADEPQKQLSKEFVRQWLIANGFQGKEGQSVPEMSEEFVNSVSDRYIELFENITGRSFEKSNTAKIKQRIEIAVTEFLATHI